MTAPETKASIETGYRNAALLSPFVRAGVEHWRGPWFIEKAKIQDYLLVHITSGSGRFSVGEQEFDVFPGDLIWIPPDTFHAMRGHPPRMLVAYIHFDLVYDHRRSLDVTPGLRYQRSPHKNVHPPWHRPPIDSWSGRLKCANGPSVYRRVKDVILEFLSANQPLKMAGLMLELLNEIASGLTQPASSAGAHVRALRRAAQEIIAKPEAELDISALARGANLSPSHFRKLFRETHRQSPRTLHDRVRMQKACELVLHSGYNVSQVAEELGFSSVHNFSRAFKRIVGVSPRAYQRKMLEVK